MGIRQKLINFKLPHAKFPFERSSRRELSPEDGFFCLNAINDRHGKVIYDLLTTTIGQYRFCAISDLRSFALFNCEVFAEKSEFA
jgi:hypothetical protein